MKRWGDEERTDPSEPFELIESLGMGGFAHTYRARVLDEDLIEDFGVDEVALKVPLSRKKEHVLRRELEMNVALHQHLKKLRSVNVVRYLGFAAFRGQLVMAMEYVRQGSLRRVLGNIGRQRPVPVANAVEIVVGILNGLTVIHSEHVIHRDIKPENILLEGQTPKIADFGIARMLNTNELASTTTGTLYYMSPEILQQGASFTSDVWSVGVTFYEMVTGRLPFGGLETPPGVLVDLIRVGHHSPACEINPDVPPEVSAIISRALEKDPAQRYSNPDEMISALKAYNREDARVEKEYKPIRESMDEMASMNEVESKLKGLVKKHPRSHKSYQYLGEFYNRCQRYPEAIAAFRKGIELNGEDALLYWDMALAYQKTGQREEAISSLSKAMALGLDASLQRHAAMFLRVLESDTI
jgi:serine/threonine-protein kinase